MNVSRSDLYRLIIEEYAKEEGVEISEDKADDLLDYIRGGERPQWMDDDEREVPAPPEVPAAPEKEDSDTFVMDIPGDDAPESEYQGFQKDSSPSDMSDEDIISSISQMIQGRDPEHVSELFQAVFAQIPGVEMGDAEEEPESLYSPGAEGRPVAGFQLQELMELIREVLEEGHYHDMGGEDEMYNALDPHGFDKMSDAELVDAMHTDGMEEMIVLDGEGDLANREEVIAALKNV